MATIEQQLNSSNNVICSNIESLNNHRSLLSQNILSQIRNLIEGIMVFVHKGSLHEQFEYEKICTALEFVKTQAKLNFLAKFHKLIQKSASHFTLEGDASERLMLKYYEHLLRARNLLRDEFRINILQNLEKFPIDLDPSLREYHERIAEKIENPLFINQNFLSRERYYIHKTRPFFCCGKIYYEVTFYRAINKANKSDRIIAFTDIDISDKYSATLTLYKDNIEIIDYFMPIILIRNWEVSIRPCEFDNFARIINLNSQVRVDSQEYHRLMLILTQQSSNLTDIMDMSDPAYASIRAYCTETTENPRIFPILDLSRSLIKQRKDGYNILRYLMLRMFNKTLKSQINKHDTCHLLTNLRLKYGCKPFDQMPYCTSLPDHNPRYWDLIETINIEGREHELLARRVKSNVENNGTLYTPVTELSNFGDIKQLIENYNKKLYIKHLEKRRMVLDKGHVFINGYEIETAEIVKELRNKSSNGIPGYSQAVDFWLAQTSRYIDDEFKVNALRNLFEKSCVALIYGAAGTGKSTMVDHISSYFNDKQKLFLAHTNPAVDNLKRKVSSQFSLFKTISSHIYNNDSFEYDILIIDECSTVSNSDFLKILKNTKFKLLILVGDIYQIESIQFGNWFSAIRTFIHKDSIFELKTPFRTNNQTLLNFWHKVRNIEDDITECIAQNGYSTILNSELFKKNTDDEIVLCLNYDGLYGINNINRFMQSSNENQIYNWRESTFKVGDPILFSETERFKPIIYNNLKGTIEAIQKTPQWIKFDVLLDRPVNAFDVMNIKELEWIKNSVVRFTVYDHPGSSDEDDDSYNTTIPFQVAYAVSIHKAQGLEYDSVKIVITDANEDDISHSICYTAITRTKRLLKIFWTPETQHNVLKKLQVKDNARDVHLLRTRCNL